MPSTDQGDPRPRRAGLPPHWRTVPYERSVLGVIHNVTSATRLLDILTVFDGDPRVQLFFTCTGSSPFTAGVREFAARHDFPLIPWDEAKEYTFDLAVATSRGGGLHEISAPLIGFPHGAGYNKKLSRKPEAGSRKPEAGSRKPEAGSRKPEAGSRKPSG
ncbi:hypothetical protein ACH4TU_03890 [Streptomyces physcomitrii]|uniref:hypothetical protein n=1 Tax=Streptomyces physcomitrii TaxID=2724184 RepID=UPI0037B2DB11